jgi:hypothetical protein
MEVTRGNIKESGRERKYHLQQICDFDDLGSAGTAISHQFHRAGPCFISKVRIPVQERIR